MRKAYVIFKNRLDRHKGVVYNWIKYFSKRGTMESQSVTKARRTLAEVAKLAGVSVSTASLVLAGKSANSRISEDTRVRVQVAAADLDYSPNRLVTSLQSGRTQILSFFNGFRNRSENDLYMDTLSTALERAAGKLGYDILVNCDFNRSAEGMYRHLNGGIVDGLLLFAPQSNEPLLPFLRKSRLPTLLLLSTDEHRMLSSVKEDVDLGMRTIAEQLVARGHHKIAALAEPAGGNDDAFDRVSRLRRHLLAASADIPSRWIVPARADGAQSYSAAIDMLMSESEPPTAIFCWHDHAAYAVLEICEARGIAVPEQLSIVGYDGLRWPAATRHTAASIKVDLNMLASTATEMLASQISEQTKEVIEYRLPVTFVEGTSLGAAARR